PLAPPGQVPQEMTLDHAPGQGLDIGKGQGAPEAAAGEAIGEAAPEGERAAILVEPVLDILGEEAGALLVFGGAGGVAPGELRIDQAVKMHGEGDVVSDAADIAVAIPAIAQIKALQLREELVGIGAVEIDAALFEAEIDQDAEEFPIVVGI